MKLASLRLILSTPFALSAKGPVFLEKGGIIAIEAESTGSSCPSQTSFNLQVSPADPSQTSQREKSILFEKVPTAIEYF